MWQKKKLKNEKGLTLVELLAVIVILAVIMIIASTSISQIIKNARADTHLENAKNILDVGKMAYVAGEEPEHEFYGAKNYTLAELSEMGYLSDKIKSPTFFGASDVLGENEQKVYNMTESIVVVDENESPVVFKVNLSVGGGNLLFENPLSKEEITRENLKSKFKEQLGIK